MCKIDVTECRYYNCGECFAEPQTDYCGEIHGYNKCDKYEDCYYKQFQQLKTENESLKQQLCNKTLEFEGIKQIIHNTLEDFSIEYGTKAYDTLLIRASKYIDVSNFK